MALIFFYVGDDEAEVGSDEAFSGFFVPALHSTCEAALFGGVLDQGKLLDVLQVLVECSGRGGTEERLRLAAIRPGHARTPEWTAELCSERPVYAAIKANKVTAPI